MPRVVAVEGREFKSRKTIGTRLKWRLPIPEFDGGDSLHVSIADAGRDAAQGVERELENLR